MNKKTRNRVLWYSALIISLSLTVVPVLSINTGNDFSSIMLVLGLLGVTVSSIGVFFTNKDSEATESRISSAVETADSAAIAAEKAALGRRLSTETKKQITRETGALDLSQFKDKRRFQIEVQYVHMATEAADLAADIVALITECGLLTREAFPFQSPTQPAPRINGVSIRTTERGIPIAEILAKHIEGGSMERVFNPPSASLVVIVGHKK